MKEISNDACVEISRLSTEGPQKPDEDNQHVIAQKNSPKRYKNYFERISNLNNASIPSY